MFITIEAPLAVITGLAGTDGLDLQSGAHDLGGGRYRVSAYVTRAAAVDEVKAAGATVTVTMDEAETQRRMQADYDMMEGVEDAGVDGGTDAGDS